ncbi:hypothetical protein QM012_008048 [Aureobasidium pullulans]|uniref:EthD domain-containing protein n=1 Tax=Aureobasidium pullulans TaxID=5580 RepID=A0ABR0TLD6_AURPU
MNNPLLHKIYPSINPTEYHLCHTWEDVKHFAQDYHNPNILLGVMDSGFGFFAGEAITGPKDTLVAICGPAAIEEIKPKFEEIQKLEETDDRTEEAKDAEAWEEVRRSERYKQGLEQGRKKEQWD